MPKAGSGITINEVYTISGEQITKAYKENKMTVHFQGMSKTLQFPHTIALQGAPTCSIGISPEGLYNRFNNAGRLILLNQNAVQLGSAPFIRISADPGVEGSKDEHVMLTTRDPKVVEGVDDVPALKNYYHAPLSEDQVSVSLATPLAEMTYTLKEVRIRRKMISPLFSGNDQMLMPVGVEEFEVKNTSKRPKKITLVLPRPSLVNLQEKELKPTDQDTVYVCSTPVKGHVHEAFASEGMTGVVMANSECQDKMVVAMPKIKNARIDIHPNFCLNRLKQDLLLNDDGGFYEKREPLIKQDYGAAISVCCTLEPGAAVTIPLAVALDFPQQHYIDGKKFDRSYLRNFKNAGTRAVELAKIALKNYPGWLDRTSKIQNRIFDQIAQSPSYAKDRAGALRLARLIFNEFSFPLSNAAVWTRGRDGKDVARFLECFDYAYINPSDVDWYSMVLLFLFPNIELELCQRFIDSILAEDDTPRFYHLHSSFVEARKHYFEFTEEYEGEVMTQVRDAFKIKGSVAHDVGAMPKGHPLRNVSDYAWYNNNYWIDLFPKLVLRVLRNVKFLNDPAFLRKNWKTLKFGLEYLMTMDVDKDGVPEGNPNEVKNTFDNLTLFGVDAYDVTTFLAGVQAMIKMAGMMKDTQAKKQYEGMFQRASESFEKLWRKTRNKKGNVLEYYITCYDPQTGKTNTDTWTNQLDSLWYLIAIGEKPFISEERAKKILKTIYTNNRTVMGWAMCRTEDGEKVESEQGQDVYTTSNYVFAQLLDYYGMAKESKEVYKAMDRVVFEFGNSLITPDNLRAEMEQEAGESAAGPHYIVAAYPRPGAVLTHVVMQFIKDIQNRTKSVEIDAKQLKTYMESLMK
jgi:uncharacterized protein (DUF608 family)